MLKRKPFRTGDDWRVEKLEQVLRELGVEGIDGHKLLAAVTHPSYKGMFPGEEDYERLEFLGDSVLDLVAAEELVLEGGELSEGAMTERRKAYVANDVLARVFDHLKLGPLLRAAVNYAPSTKDRANVVEAIFGAVFLSRGGGGGSAGGGAGDAGGDPAGTTGDAGGGPAGTTGDAGGGYGACRRLWAAIRERIGLRRKTRVRPPGTLEEAENKGEYEAFYRVLGLVPKNAKSSLQELCQKQGLPLPEYELVSREGPDHDPTFTVKVTARLFDSAPPLTFTALGEGSTKKLAEIRAAEALCDQVFLPYTPSS
ncbi:MAG: ribonuclease III family protein [Promethearchaeota archaeon]